ncbi:MAG: hypothetical protein NZ992_03675 [Candidatus Korarchaeum sp.]|nr:hypothetical protein [Candidatus Korarchaeum sp.]
MTLSYDFILVLGGGRYGSIAVNRLKEKSKTILVVDRNPNCLAATYVDKLVTSFSPRDISQGGVFLLIEDGMSLLLDLMKGNIVPAFIVLTVPRNVMASLFIESIRMEGFNIKFDKEYMEKTALNIPEEYILVKDPEYGVIVTSYARQDVCVEGCVQPLICPLSGERRNKPMIELLRQLVSGDYVKIFESHLIERDVGGVPGEEVREALESFRNGHLKKGAKIAIGTACKCHGIVNFMNIV